MNEQHLFEQLSKEMAVFAQNNAHSFGDLQEFFLYELKLRCIPKRELKKILDVRINISPDFKEQLSKMCKEVDDA